MGLYLGLDTSNYTTSAALYDSDTNQIQMRKQLLPVKDGSIGLRQSEAVFLHVRQLPALLEELSDARGERLSGIGVSVSPRRAEGSYMPCFLVGDAVAVSLAAMMKIPKYAFSHQEGHIMAALYSADRMQLADSKFYAFHVSGGTTECLLVQKDGSGFQVKLLSASLDLKAGQAVDRVGGMLGLPFPAGKYLDELAQHCEEPVRVRPALKGLNCSFSGLENQCRKMLSENREPAYIAKYCISFVTETIAAMTEAVFAEYGYKPVLYAGGVMANSMARETLTGRFDGYFAQPEYSSDNSAGIAILAAMADQR